MRLMEKRARPHACALAAMAVFGSAMAMDPQRAAADVNQTRLAERVQLQRNAPRGLEYVRTSDPSAKATQGRSSIGARVGRLIHLDGNPIDNSYSSVLPMDPNRDGKFSFVHWNGHRIMRAYDPAGSKAWQVTNSAARKQGPGTYIHRDNAAILDLNGDRRDDILHCWQSGSTKRLVARDGSTGKEIRHVALAGQSNSEGSFCRLAVYRKQSDKKPIILVGHSQPGGSGKCGGRNWVDNWTRVVAFDTSLKRLWEASTCDAGHQTAGVDLNGDGLMEHFFVGKYALSTSGKVRCTLEGWNRNDHVDAIRIARLDPSSRTTYAVAVGTTGGGAFDASTCKRIWTVPGLVKNPQEMLVAQFDPAPRPLSIMMSRRSGQGSAAVFVLDWRGKVVRTMNNRKIMGMQNAELDGNRRTDEAVAIFGEVFDGNGRKLLSRNWYWNLKGNKIKQVRANNSYDQWVAYPLLFDVDSDGRDELVTWGQSLIVVGELN